MLDGRDRLLREQLGHEPHHHLAVLEHVRHARGGAQVVLQNVVLAGPGTHEVDAGDVRVNAAGDLDALHLRAVLGILEHFGGWDLARLDDLALVIDVLQEQVQCPRALAQAGLQLAPFGDRNDVRQHVEWDQPLAAALLAVHRERDAHAVK